MKRIRIVSAILLTATLVFAIAACGGRKKVKVAKPARIGSTETGVASWYGVPYHGRRAANGEIYDMEKLTAAHRTLPFGTWVRVRNLTNNETVDVRIQDRGPFVGNRIIDLSHAAAREIEMLGPGTVKVRLTIIAPSKVREPKIVEAKVSKPPRPGVVPGVQEIPPAKIPAAKPPVAGVFEPQAVEPELFAVQIGAFQDRVKAEALRVSLTERYGVARIVVREGRSALYRVLVGEEDSIDKAAALVERMRVDGTSGFIVRLDTVPPQI